MYLTADMLREKNACHRQVAVFEKEWPDGVKTTKKAILRAVELELDICWFADNFLPPPIWKAYNEVMVYIRKAYKEAMASARKAYEEAIAPTREAYEEVMAPAREAYKEAIVPAREAFEEATALALKAYKKAIAFAEKAYRKAQASALYKVLKENKPWYLTADMLREKNACHRQVAVFEKEWPDGVKITKKAIIRAVELELDINWFVDNFLPPPIREAYQKAIDLAWKAYKEAIAFAPNVYKEAAAPAREAYEEAQALVLYKALKENKPCT